MSFWSYFKFITPLHCLSLSIFFRAVGSPLNFDPNRICRRSRKLRGSSKQRDICLREPEIVQEVVRGTKLGMLECQFQLRHHRWNCTTMHNSFIKVIRHGEWWPFQFSLPMMRSQRLSRNLLKENVNFLYVPSKPS